MNFKSILALGLGVATIGLSVPAFADSVTLSTTDQEVVVTGSGNRTTQRSKTDLSSYERKNRDSSAVDVSTKQKADILGDDNKTTQNSDSSSTRIRRGNR
jgi:hypothetical protein